MSPHLLVIKETELGLSQLVTFAKIFLENVKTF